MNETGQVPALEFSFQRLPSNNKRVSTLMNMMSDGNKCDEDKMEFCVERDTSSLSGDKILLSGESSCSLNELMEQAT